MRKVLADSILEGFGITPLSQRISEGNSDNTRDIAQDIVGDFRLNGPSRYGSYYKDYKAEKVRVRFSDHLPIWRILQKENKGVSKLILILTKDFDDSEVSDHVTELLDTTASEGRTDLPKKYPYIVVGESPDESQIKQAKLLIGKHIKVPSSASMGELNQRLFESVLKLDRIDKFQSQTEIPNIGFIKPDGTFIDIEKYGFDSHSDFVRKITESVPTNESSYSDLLAFTEQGYIRFKIDDTGTITEDEAVIQTATYPTRQQFRTIRDCIDYVGEGVLEIFINRVPKKHLEMTRDTLQRDMVVLEKMLNEVNPPSPKL